MSIGFSYRIERSRASAEFRRVKDNTANFLRLRDPSNPNKFYDFTSPPAGISHVVKLYAANNAYHSTHTISAVTAHDLIVATDIQMVPPSYGVGETYEIYQKDPVGALTLLTQGKVSGYAPEEESNYLLDFHIKTAVNVQRELFLVRQANDIDLTPDLEIVAVAGDPYHERVVTEDEVFMVPKESDFSFDTQKAGYQRYRSATFSGKYKNKEQADAVEASLLGQLAILVAKLAAPQSLQPAFAVSPGAGVVQIGQQVAMYPVGKRGEVSWLFTQNESGGIVSEEGVYQAGPDTGTDIIEVKDAAGNTITLTFDVQDTYTSTFDGEFTWQPS